MEKLKIILAIRSLNFGGAERQFVLLAQELAKRDDVELLLFTLYGGGRLEYEIIGIPHICLNKRGRWDFGFLWRYYREMRTFRAHCVYAFMPEMNIFSLLCGIFARTKVVFGFRSSAINVGKLSFASKLCFYVQKFLSPFAKAIICNSKDAIEFYKSKGYATKRAVVVYNGIDTTRFCPKDAEEFRKEFGFKRDTFVVGISARMDVVKNYPLFAQVAKGFLQDLERNLGVAPNVAFVALGKCEMATLKQCVEILKPYEALFLGAKNDVERYYPLFDCILSTSNTESFSNSIAEGMACGCIPIVSDVGESKVIADFKQDSYQFYFSIGDAKGALQCLKSLYAIKDSPQFAELKKQAREHIVKEFSPQSMLNQTLKILREL